MAGISAAAIAAYVSAAAAAAGAAVSAVSSIQAGKQQDKVAAANARMAEYQAKQAKEAAELKASQYSREAERRMSAMRAGFAASGVSTAEGTPLLVLMESAEEVAKDELRIRRGGEMTAWGLLQEANIQKMSGTNAATQGYWGAGSSLLGGAGRVANVYSNYKGGS